MLITSNVSQKAVNTSTVVETSYKSTGQITSTDIEGLNERGREEETTQTKPNKDTSQSISPVENAKGDEFSSKYISHSSSLLIKEIVTLLQSWEKNGTVNSILEISNIKDKLDTFITYLHEEPTNRILVSLIILIFKNNNWAEMKPNQIRQVWQEIKRFENGYISQDEVKHFSQQLFRNNISVAPGKSDD